MSDEPEAPRARPARGGRIDLDGMSAPELKSLLNAVEAKLSEKIEAEKAAILDEASEKLAAIGLSIDSLFPSRPSSSAFPVRRGRGAGPGAPVPVKYRGPNGETWSGRGRTPTWLSALEDQGKSRDQFKVGV